MIYPVPKCINTFLYIPDSVVNGLAVETGIPGLNDTTLKSCKIAVDLAPDTLAADPDEASISTIYISLKINSLYPTE